MSSLPEEEENYVRMSLLLTGLSPRAVRAFFDKEFPPTYLPSTLNQKYNTLLSLQKIRVINQAQWNLLFPKSSVVDSKTFDVTLMICLIRNLTSVTPPATGFDRLPSTGDTSPGADLARIKYYRNYLAHLDDNKISKSDFNTSWNDISNAVDRLGGSSMYHECQDLRTTILDQSNHEIMLEIKNCMGNVTDLKQLLQNADEKMNELKVGHEQKMKEVEKLKIDHEQKTKEIDILKTEQEQKTKEIEKLKTYHEHNTKEIEKLMTYEEIRTKEIEIMKDPVPWNIREQMLKKIENWKKDDQMFVNTRGASYVLRCIKTNNCVTVTASSGVGKTFTVRHVALQMSVDGYDILPVLYPEDIIKFNNPNKKTLYVIDDLCGTYTLNLTTLDKWKTTHEDIKELLKNKTTKIIASCRLQVYQDEDFKSLTLFTAYECNLLSPDKSLSEKERQLIAEKYLKSDATKISQVIHLFDFFPLLCKLYNEYQQLNVVDFFNNPFSVYEVEINTLRTERAYGKYCALALCVIFNNHLKEEWLTDDVNQEILQIIKNTCEACKLNRCTSRLLLRDELDSLIHTFLKKEQGCYSTIHDKLFDFVSFYFGKELTLCLIRNSDCRLIAERFLFESKDDFDQFRTIIPDKYQQIYIERMIDDWFKGEVVLVFTNINMKSPNFRSQFLKHLRTRNISYQKQLASTYDNASKFGSASHQNWNDRMKTPLLHCCILGDINLVKWCCSNCADVNYGGKGKSPLYIACERGYTDIVIELVDNKADVNKGVIGPLGGTASPLYIACARGFTDIVTKLVDNKADVNISTKSFFLIEDSTPLYAACYRGYTDIATKLVDNNADINFCNRAGESLLYVAFKGGYTDIVNKLIDNKADINICTNDGESLLYVACKVGHTGIVTKLVDNKAEINICSKDGESPLYVACKGGYTDIVTKLVDNNADVNMCAIIKRSRKLTPLYIACELGYTDIVTNLVDNKADVNLGAIKLFRKISPLYIACNRGYTGIVAKLVDNKADINICTEDGESPLYVSCKGGYTDIVAKLVDNKAYINICTKDGESPLYVACKGGFTDIVTKLVNNVADINKYTDVGESPLYVACKGGHTDIVIKLVESKADINYCTDDGPSALYIACKGGYTDMVTTLIDNNADIYKCTKYEESPLYVACKGGYLDLVTKLIHNKADVNKCTHYGASPLYVACEGGYIDIVTKLIENGADINNCTSGMVRGQSPLYVACKGGFTDIVTKLIVNNANINMCRFDGQSPLYVACKQGYIKTVKLLISKGADYTKCDNNGKSPLIIAKNEGHDTVVDFICKYSSDKI